MPVFLPLAFSRLALSISLYLSLSLSPSLSLPLSHTHILEDGVERPEQFQEYLSSLSVPAPWAAGRTVETIHPVRDNYKFKDTVTIPGARSIFLRFDPRCATQYDYDKVRQGATDKVRQGVTDKVRQGATDKVRQGVTDKVRQGVTDKVRQGATDKVPPTRCHRQGVTDKVRQGATDKVPPTR